jgi:peptidoglycan/LPS O-acetylase OafA/YrhL
MALAAAFSVGVRVWVYTGSASLQAMWDVQLPNRLIEFVWGICVARLYAAGRRPPAILAGSRGFVVAAAIAYAGRTLMVTEVIRFAGDYGPICKILSEPVLTLGCALIVWNVVSSGSWFERVLSRDAFQAVGRWSYSLYLWHWWPAWWISGALAARYGSNPVVQHGALALCLMVLVPLSALSYRLLERPYFERQRPLTPSSSLRRPEWAR